MKLTIQIVLTERDKSNYRFPSIVKNNTKKTWNFQKWERKNG